MFKMRIGRLRFHGVSVLFLAIAFSTSSLSHASLQDDIRKRALEQATKVKEYLFKEKSYRGVLLDQMNKQNTSYPDTSLRTLTEVPPDIAAMDKSWTEWFGKAQRSKFEGGSPVSIPAFVKERVRGPCAELFREVQGKYPFISEIFIMDRMGGLVCAAQPTSDFDQGDEEKWIETYFKRARAYVDDPRFDSSTETFQNQISFLIENNGIPIGAMTIGISLKVILDDP